MYYIHILLVLYWYCIHVISKDIHSFFFVSIVSSVDVRINVVSSRQGKFTVTCTASGGTVVSSSLTGPRGVDLELEPVWSIGRTGQNTYSTTSGTLSGRSNGNTYQCTAAANLSSLRWSRRVILLQFTVTENGIPQWNNYRNGRPQWNIAI